MAFPFSISGGVQFRRSDLTASQTIVERLEAALSAQTVDRITVTGDAIEFMPQTKGTGDKPRPEGNGWMLNGLGTCFIQVIYNQDKVMVRYKLDCRLWFGLTTVIALGVGFAIRSSTGPDPEWGWAFACGLWTVVFLLAYISKAIEFRGWLKNTVTSHLLPPTKRLRVPAGPD